MTPLTFVLYNSIGILAGYVSGLRIGSLLLLLGAVNGVWAVLTSGVYFDIAETELVPRWYGRALMFAISAVLIAFACTV